MSGDANSRCPRNAKTRHHCPGRRIQIAWRVALLGLRCATPVVIDSALPRPSGGEDRVFRSASGGLGWKRCRRTPAHETGMRPKEDLGPGRYQTWGRRDFETGSEVVNYYTPRLWTTAAPADGEALTQRHPSHPRRLCLSCGGGLSVADSWLDISALRSSAESVDFDVDTRDFASRSRT